MKKILVVGEDVLCCALGEKLVAAALPSWRLAGPSIDKKGITKLTPDLTRYINQARYVQPVLCIADTDGKCAKKLLESWRPLHATEDFILRLAVTEAESWILADRQEFSAYLKVPINRVPHNTDSIADPKRLVLTLAARSGKRVFRDEMVSYTDPNKPGSGYNLHLSDFVRTRWRAQSAKTVSESLDRAMNSLSRVRERH
ncbi:DUF4276 family protein [Candidimonas humi]|uniref:DUF4276 family protein n=1 Tax=Candidimonas humi TaxID=683355 RepID=A0ABV8NYZ5_9BURK|nr:DUF4276 family protein [Candidimonas humi]MBV6304370.1 DUF4276 family protein [Candidimonas humi]